MTSAFWKNSVLHFLTQSLAPYKHDITHERSRNILYTLDTSIVYLIIDHMLNSTWISISIKETLGHKVVKVIPRYRINLRYELQTKITGFTKMNCKDWYLVSRFRTQRKHFEKMDKLKNTFKNIQNVFNPKDIYSSHRPMLIAYRVEGLFPFKLNEDKSQLLSSKMGFSFSIFQFTMYFVCFFTTIFDNHSFVVYFFQTEISVIGGYLQFFNSCVAVVIFYMVSIVYRHKMRFILENLYRLDKRFEDLYQEIDHKATFYLGLVGCTILVTVNSTFILLSFLLLGSSESCPDFVVWISFFFPYILLTLVVVKFVTVLGHIQKRFKGLAEVRNRFSCDVIKDCTMLLLHLIQMFKA